MSLYQARRQLALVAALEKDCRQQIDVPVYGRAFARGLSFGFLAAKGCLETLNIPSGECSKEWRVRSYEALRRFLMSKWIIGTLQSSLKPLEKPITSFFRQVTS
jgi:hypothetical protein